MFDGGVKRFGEYAHFVTHLIFVVFQLQTRNSIVKVFNSDVRCCERNIT